MIGSLPSITAWLVALNAIYIVSVALGNIISPIDNWLYVKHVLSMDTTSFGTMLGRNLSDETQWRSVTNPKIQLAVYILIIFWESLSGIILVAATFLWYKQRGTNYFSARALSSIGLLMIILLFFGGFIIVGGEWFQMWKSTSWNGLNAAFRITVLATFPLVLIHLPFAFWQRQPDEEDPGEEDIENA